MAEEFDYLLHWDLPISTFVEFNEVGKSLDRQVETHISTIHTDRQEKLLVSVTS